MRNRNLIALTAIAALIAIPAMPAFAQQADVFNPADPITTTPPAGPGIAPPPPGTVLYDNGPFVTAPGLSTLQNTSLLMTILGFGDQTTANNRMGDDFTVPAGETWTVDSITVYNYQTGSPTTSTITGVNLDIYDGDPATTGAVIASSTTINSTGWTNIFRVTETTLTATNRPIMQTEVDLGGLELTEGTYWMVWDAAGSLGSGPWAPPITIVGQSTTGNAQQSIAGVWGPATDVGQQGVPFIVSGTIAGGDPVITVPTLGTWGLIILALALAGVGFFVMRRRSVTA